MRKYFCTLCLLPALFIAFSATNTKAEDLIIEDELDPDAQITGITLAWDKNRERDIVGYNVYFGRDSDVYIGFVTVTGTTALVGVKGQRTVYFAVTAFNTYGVESELSEEVQWP